MVDFYELCSGQLFILKLLRSHATLHIKLPGTTGTRGTY